jgi:7-cyano-7-deazaguanine synthase
MNSFKKQVTVLFSGGIDSTACLHYYKKLNYNVDGLFINYGQLAIEKERIAIRQISDYYSIETEEIFIATQPLIKNGVIQGRNLLLLSIAVMNYTRSSGLISLGIHSGTVFPDCSKEFILNFQGIVDMYFNGSIIIDCPFIDFSKREIYEFCITNKVPLSLTYSCELGKIQPCGKCSSCKDLITLYEI